MQLEVSLLNKWKLIEGISEFLGNFLFSFDGIDMYKCLVLGKQFMVNVFLKISIKIH